MKLNICLTVLIALVPTSALAYIEPGSALMVTQIIIGALIGGVVTLKLYWQRIKDKFFDGPNGKNGGRQTGAMSGDGDD